MEKSSYMYHLIYLTDIILIFMLSRLWELNIICMQIWKIIIMQIGLKNILSPGEKHTTKMNFPKLYQMGPVMGNQVYILPFIIFFGKNSIYHLINKNIGK